MTSTGEIECDNVVLSVGVRPAVELAEKAGIEIGMTGGIRTDGSMMTSSGRFMPPEMCAKPLILPATRPLSMPSGPWLLNRDGLPD